jgi:crotonobetainyl-CoA:carnitine CoA-transferase CaiB-like acyl-CoA transferase
VPAASWPAYAATRAQRLEDSPVTATIEQVLAGHTVESALALLRQHRVAAESPRLITNNEAIRLPILHEHGIMSVTQHAEEGEMWQVAPPLASACARTRSSTPVR